MRISVASGKGGTGKTTVAVNLALALGQCTLVDCDVEEPNCALFLDAKMERVEDVTLPVPVFDLERCTYCGECADFCMYHAIAVFPEKLVFFPEVCQSCGGCQILCPVEAVGEEPRKIGEIERGKVGGITLYQGRLDIGEPLATPIIRRVKALATGDPIVYDAPPGTACPVIETVKDSDFTLLVTEPTPFGLHDLRLAVAVVRGLGVPLGVIINRDGAGDDRVLEYCRSEGIEVIMRIPHDRRIAELYSRGVPFVQEMEEYRVEFENAFRRMEEMAR